MISVKENKTVNSKKDITIIILLAVISILMMGMFFYQAPISRAHAETTYRYKMVKVPFTVGQEKEVEKVLNRYGAEGWDVADWHGGWVIFQK